MNTRLLSLVALGVSTASSAGIYTEAVEYLCGDATLEGYLADDEASDGRRPGVLVVHEWSDLSNYAKLRARQLAELGCVTFAAEPSEVALMVRVWVTCQVGRYPQPGQPLSCIPWQPLVPPSDLVGLDGHAAFTQCADDGLPEWVGLPIGRSRSERTAPTRSTRPRMWVGACERRRIALEGRAHPERNGGRS